MTTARLRFWQVVSTAYGVRTVWGKRWTRREDAERAAKRARTENPAEPGRYGYKTHEAKLFSEDNGEPMAKPTPDSVTIELADLRRGLRALLKRSK